MNPRLRFRLYFAVASYVRWALPTLRISSLSLREVQEFDVFELHVDVSFGVDLQGEVTPGTARVVFHLGGEDAVDAHRDVPAAGG